jgi:dienelactone hydrolase
MTICAIAARVSMSLGLLCAVTFTGCTPKGSRRGNSLALEIPTRISGTPHPITMDETLAMREIRTFALSPDGKSVAFAVRQAFPEQNRYAYALFVTRSDGRSRLDHPATKLADVSDVAALQWTADGENVTYIAPDRGVRQVWIIPADGGKPRALTESRVGVGTGLANERLSYFPPYALSPDGKSLAYFTWDSAAAVAKAAAQKKGPFVFDESQVNTTLDVGLPASWSRIPIGADLWLTELRTGKTERVWQMPGTMQVNDDPAGTIPPELSWAPDSKAIALVYYPKLPEGDFFVRHLGLYSVKEKEFKPLLEDIGWTLYPVWFPDGSGIAVRSDGRRTPDSQQRFQYYEYRFADKSFNVVEAPNDPAARAGRALGGDTARATECVTNPSRRSAACLFESPRLPPEIIVADVDPAGAVTNARVVTSVNPEFRNIRIAEQEQLSWSWPNAMPDRPGATLVKPLGYEQGKRYPVIVMAYNQGNPNRFVGQVWSNWPAQSFAAKGYVVLLVNFPPIGFQKGNFTQAKLVESDGPCMAIDSAIKRVIDMGLADTTRMGLMGWSWGSYVTSYYISHHNPSRFKAAASSEGQLYNLSAFWIGAGEGRTWMLNAFGGGPFGETEQRWKQMSPTSMAHRVTVPVLQEYSTHNTGGFEFNAAVTLQGGAAEMHFYPDEVHVFEQPRNRLHSMWLNYDWFNYWILGEEDPAPAKRGQYTRWAAMKAKLAKKVEGRAGA